MVEWRNSHGSAAAAPPIGALAAVTDVDSCMDTGVWAHDASHSTAGCPEQYWPRSTLAASCQWSLDTVV